MSPSRPVVVHLSRPAMGSEFEIVLWGDEASQVTAAGEEALEAISGVERQLSHTDPRSDLSLLNASAATAPTVVDADLLSLIARCVAWSRETSGAFDITAGALIRLWSAAIRTQHDPMPDELSVALAATGMRHLRLDAETRTVAFDSPDLALHFGAIGKGYALDVAAERLRAAEVDGAFLHGGGSSVLGIGLAPDGGPWRVGILDPRDESRRLGTIALTDRALSVSGTQRQSATVAGGSRGHLLDPRTGLPVEGMVGATALAANAAEAEAFSTALFVLGVEDARSVLERRPGIGALLFPAAAGRCHIMGAAVAPVAG